MTKFYNWLLTNGIAINSLLSRPQYREYPYFEDLKLARAQIQDDVRFMNTAMRGRTYAPWEESNTQGQKVEVLSHINEHLHNQLKKGYSVDTVFRQHETTKWLDLFRRATRHDFATYKEPDQISENILGAGPPAYGPPRDPEMFWDYLLNFMNEHDATYIYNFVSNFF